MNFLIYLSFILFSSQTLAQLVDSIEKKKKDYQQIRRSHFSLLPHRQMFLMPFTHNWMTHNDIYSIQSKDSKNEGDLYRSSEAEFQVSFAVPMVKGIAKKDWDIMGAFTQHSFWQVYNAGWSRPFRETNYMPELFSRYVYKHPKEVLGIKLYGIDAGYIHQSNGQVQEISRSWDRLFVRGIVEVFDTYIQLSAWHRVSESRKVDDNRDILDYMGYGEAEITKKFENHTFHLKIPLFSKYMGYDFKYSYPLSDRMRWFVNYRSGYGQSMIEYNRQTQRIGFGFLLENVFY